MLRHAFTYEWRVWGLAELRELLIDAGFSATRVHLDADDEDGAYRHGAAPATDAKLAEAEPSEWFSCYIVAST